MFFDSEPAVDKVNTAFPPGSFGSKLEHFETTFLEYLQEAHVRLEKCNQACRTWQYPYDGEIPPPTCLGLDIGNVSHVLNISMSDSSLQQREVNSIVVYEGREINSNANASSVEKQGSKTVQSNSNTCDSSLGNDFQPTDSAIDNDILKDDISLARDMASYRETFTSDKELMQFLDESGSPLDKSVSVEDSVKCLDTLMSSVSASFSRTSTPRKDLTRDGTLDTNFGDENEMSTVYYDCETSQNEGLDVFKSINETSYEIIEDPAKDKTNNASEFEILGSQTKIKTGDGTEFEIVDTRNNCNLSSKTNNVTSFIDITSGSENSVLKAKSQEEKTKPILDDIEEVDDSLNIVDDHYKALTKGGILVTKSGEKDNESVEQKDKGDKSVRFAETVSAPNLHELPSQSLLGVGMTSVKQSPTPNIGKLVAE